MTEPNRLGVSSAGADLQVLAAPIRTVLVMEDRAQVTRRAEAELEAGRNRVQLSGVTPLLADRTLRCRVRSVAGGAADEEGARVLDASVRRRYLVRPARPDREQEVLDAIDTLADEYLLVHDSARARFSEREAIARALSGFRRQLLDRLVVGPFEPVWRDEIERAFDRRQTLEAELLSDQWDQRDRRERLDRLVEELRLALAPIPEYSADIGVELWLPQAGRLALEVEYQVPCALWRPSYAAELVQVDGADRVAWCSAGTVWQLSGEDWRAVELSFSTARPTLGAELPQLSDDRLRARDKTERERQVVEVASRDQVIAKTTDAEQQQADTPPGLDDGGEARTYRVPDPVDVPSDGRPHRIEFDRWEQPARCELVCMPEEADFVFLRSEQTNPTALPLLAGPVRLVRDGGYQGLSQIRFVAALEAFALSWGSDDGLVVMRQVEREFEETSIRKRRLHDFKIETYLANHSGQPRALKLFERVPLAEIDRVEVEIDPQRTTAGSTRDEQGLLSWPVELAPGQEKRIELVFRVSMPSNVVWQG